MVCLLGKKVLHNSWGTGEIVSVDNKPEGIYLTVKFISGEKRFGYPASFEKFLRFEDIALQEQAVIDFQEELNRKREREEQEERLRAERAMLARAASTGTQKRTYPRRNIVFKCTYCDGGRNEEKIGFDGICSEENLKNNVLKEKHIWCSAEESKCRMVCDGKISRAQLEDEYAKNCKCVCYESHLFRSWEYGAGRVVHGENQGEPISMRNAQTNSLCVLTTLKPEKPQEERVIFGVFVIVRAEEGDDVSEGRVTAHPKYRIVLSDEEAEKMNFWNYYENKTDKSDAYKKFWGANLFRYLNDGACVQILEDIVEIKKGKPDEPLARETLDYFLGVIS